MSSILSLLSDRQKLYLSKKNKQVKLQTGEILFQQGAEARCMYRVEKGKISLFRLMSNGDEKLFKVLLSGETVAEMAIFMQPRRYAMSAKADQESILSVFSYEDIIKFATDSPDLSLQIMHHMSNHIHYLMDTVNILTQVSANQRLVMKLAEIYRLQKDEGKMISLPATKKLLATQLCMTPETLSRVIKKLKNENLIVESGGNLTIPDISRLCISVNLTTDIFE